MDIQDAEPVERYKTALPENEYNALSEWSSSFYDFQKEIIFSLEDFALINKSRQIGLSHSLSGCAVLWGAFHGETTTIVSIGQRESNEVLSTAKKHARLLYELGSDMAALTKSTATEIGFASGGRILALPSSSGGRGYSGSLILDEAAYLTHFDAVYDAAAAVTTLGGRLRVSSTPNGVGNGFHDLYEHASDTDSEWRLFEVTIDDARKHGFPVNEKKLWATAKGDPRLFNQLFKCSFLDAVLQYLPTEEVDACRTGELDGPFTSYYGGLDIGRENDLTVLTVVGYNDRMRRVQRIVSRKRTSMDDILEIVGDAFETYKLTRLSIDETGLGIFPCDVLVKKFGEKYVPKNKRPRVEPIPFGLKSKEEIATGLYGAIAGRTVALPRNDQLPGGGEPGIAAKLRKDLLSLQRIVTRAGNVVYDAPRTKSGHADAMWSLGLALHATGQPNAMLEALQRRMMGRAA